jgi:predicted dienelactone hydrolase
MHKTAAIAGLTAFALAATTLPAAAAAAPTPTGRSTSASPAATSTATSSQTPRSASATPVLPRPTGAFPIGVTDLHLIDSSRPDPWNPPQPYRELMVSVVYPARNVAGYERAPLMTQGVSDGFNTLAAPDNYGVPAGTTIDWAAIKTYEHEGAPAATGRHPVLLYSPGVGDIRSWDSVLVDQLASEGYVVVIIDPTYEASAVQFPADAADPDGRVIDSNLLSWFAKAQQDGTVTQLLEQVLDTRVADVKFVLDELTELAAGGDPDAEHSPLPQGLAHELDLSRVGMFGQSAGGFTALEAMYEDPRLKAGVDMDGTLEFDAGAPTDTNFSPVAQHGLAKPFLLLGSQTSDACTAATDPSCAAVLEHSTGWHRALTLPDTVHGSFTDAEAIFPQLSGVVPDAVIEADTGTADPDQVLAEQERLLSGFFHHAL